MAEQRIHEWLLERLAEEEARLRSPWREQWHSARCIAFMGSEKLPCECGGPVQMLADIEGKRQIISKCAELLEFANLISNDADDLARLTLRSLALPFADHPGCRPEWKL